LDSFLIAVFVTIEDSSSKWNELLKVFEYRSKPRRIIATTERNLKAFPDILEMRFLFACETFFLRCFFLGIA
jgi:hypothetical protein